MTAITVRRWVASSPPVVWDRLLARLADHDVRARPDEAHLTVTLVADRVPWLLTIAVDPMPGDHGCGSDVRLHAEPDPTARRRRGPRVVTRRPGHGTQRIQDELDALARLLARPERAPQRMAPGR